MTALDTFNVLPLRDREPIAGPFYAHPYGGIARDISVSKEGFARFFEWSLAEVDFAMMCVQGHGGKVIDTFDDWSESLGYIDETNGKRTYMITIINRDHSRVGELLKIAPYLWHESGQVLDEDDCAPHGIERPKLELVEDDFYWGDHDQNG